MFHRAILAGFRGEFQCDFVASQLAVNRRHAGAWGINRNLAAGLPADRQSAFSGAMLFVILDLILSIEFFVLPDGHKMQQMAAWSVRVCYIAAQVFLLWGLLG